MPGRTVNRMSGAYRGEAKTDARDAYVIAETVRHRGRVQAFDVAHDQPGADVLGLLREVNAVKEVSATSASDTQRCSSWS